MADGESKKTSGICAHCQKPTASTCEGCQGAPLYDEYFIEPAFYCSSECLKADWVHHESKCKELQDRKSLARAAMLLQAIMYRIRMHASTLQFKSLRLEGSTIFLDGYHFAESHSREPERVLKPFPVPLNGDRSLAEAVLVYLGCGDAMTYLHSFAEELLTGLYSEIEDCTVSVIDQKLQICPVFPDGQRTASPDSVYHNLYKVTLKSGEIWVVDTTGAQHGYPDPLSPWPGFEQRRSCKLASDCKFGTIRRNVEQNLMNRPSRQMVAQTTERLELCAAIEEKIPAWAHACGGRLNVILGGSDAIFENAKDWFLDQLENHLRVSMIKLYTPDQIIRRNNSVDLQFSRNQPNADEKPDEELEFIAGSRGDFCENWTTELS